PSVFAFFEFNFQVGFACILGTSFFVLGVVQVQLTLRLSSELAFGFCFLRVQPSGGLRLSWS
ncbi:31647_t:CDS:2, partial [Racocetra persica]